MTLTYVDAGFLIAAFRGDPAVSARALAILQDAYRSFVSGPFVDLAVIPTAHYYSHQKEVDFYQAILANVETVESSSLMIGIAFDRACAYGLGTLEALDVAAAELARADEMIVAKKRSQPLFRVRTMNVVSLFDD